PRSGLVQAAITSTPGRAGPGRREGGRRLYGLSAWDPQELKGDFAARSVQWTTVARTPTRTGLHDDRTTFDLYEVVNRTSGSVLERSGVALLTSVEVKCQGDPKTCSGDGTNCAASVEWAPVDSGPWPRPKRAGP
ncbi:MAG: hypothetical protein RL385_5650, partial [Pseudomonadota bacterium]